MKLLFALFVFCCASCTTIAQEGRLPATRPADMILTYHFDGGMQYYSEDLSIGKDSCVFTKNDEGKKTSHHFTLSSMELDVLYEKLQSNKFDMIKSKKSQVDDRGGISITVSWDKRRKSIIVSDAQSSFVEKDWQQQWQTVCNYLLAILQNKVKGVEVKIKG